MSDDHYLSDFPDVENPPPLKKKKKHTPVRKKAQGDPFLNSTPFLPPAETNLPAPQPSQQNRWASVWDGISRAGLAEVALRLGTHALLVALILIVAWGMRELYLRAQVSQAPVREAALAAGLPTATPTPLPPELPAYTFQVSYQQGLSRRARLHTDVPSRPRLEATKYTVKEGDTLFDIAEKFGLKPETILWSNYEVLGDNPHKLRPGQELNILPVDGTYHKWSEGDGLNGVAKFFGVKPEDIINFPGNHLDPDKIGDWSHPNIEPGTWIIVPGGRREFVSWSAPEIPRSNPKVASVLGPGACSSVVDGAVGSSTLIWPANRHIVSGFDYNPGANHSGIDIDGELGDPVYAVDNGVVVYAGWNNWGYGNVVVINHGNGWQTLYAHLSSYYVGCGQSVYQGTQIGAIGSTGNSTGSHLHFEMMYKGTKVNPHDYLP